MLNINTYKDGREFVVEWCTLNKVGFLNISAPTDLPDAKATVEVFALAKLLERWPNLARHVVTSQGAVRKLLRGVFREGSGEAGYLKVKYQDLIVKSSRKTPIVIANVIAKSGVEPEVEHLEWKPLGRPGISSPVGELSVTVHAMEQYREHVAPTGTLLRLEKFLAKNWHQVSVSKVKPSERAIRHVVYAVENTGFHIVVTDQMDGSRRLRTCYSVQ